MGAVWETRIVQTDDGTLRFAEVRFRVDGSTSVSGILSIDPRGKTIDAMRAIVKQLESACDRAIIGPNGEDPERLEDEDEDEDEDC